MKPVQLARLHTRDIFSFRCRVSVHVSTIHVSRFGRVEWRARLPLADWIRPALWLMPERDTYGGKSIYSTVQYSTVQHSTVQHSTVQYSTVQYSTYNP